MNTFDYSTVYKFDGDGGEIEVSLVDEGGPEMCLRICEDNSTEILLTRRELETILSIANTLNFVRHSTLEVVSQ